MSDDNFPKNLELVERFRPMTTKYRISMGQITLAQIIAENPDFISVPGSCSVERLEANVKAGETALNPGWRCERL